MRVVPIEIKSDEYASEDPIFILPSCAKQKRISSLEMLATFRRPKWFAESVLSSTKTYIGTGFISLPENFWYSLSNLHALY